MNSNNITKIEIWSRGKNRDMYGNPYHAFKAVLHFTRVSYFNTLTIQMPMSWGDSDKRGCLIWACQGIKEALGLDIQIDDERIVHHYKQIYKDSELENPENWKCN